MTSKMQALLDYFAFEVGQFEARTLRLRDSTTAVALRRRGLLLSSPGGRHGKQLDWWITPKGVEVAEANRAERRATR